MSDRPFYDGATLHIRAYDSMHEPVPPVIAGDTEFYLELAGRGDGPVLELGAGTGRVALALADMGLDVTGLDKSIHMLDLARRKAADRHFPIPPRFVEGDMRDFAFDRQFGTILVPYRGFQPLLTVEDQLASLATMRQHLVPGGRLALHLFDPRLELLVPGGGESQGRIGIDAEIGQRIEATLLGSDVDLLHQIRTSHWRYRLLDEADHVLVEEQLSLPLRWTWRSEMQHLLARTGFEILAEYSDFFGAPPVAGKEQIWVARPA